jgi:hypothetical protein
MIGGKRPPKRGISDWGRRYRAASAFENNITSGYREPRKSYLGLDLD